MKHIWMALAVFALTLAIGLMSVFYVRAVGEQTSRFLEQSQQQILREDYAAAQELLQKAKDAWEGRLTILGIFLHHEEADEVMALFAQMEAFVLLQDADDYLAACGELTARIAHIRDMELPKLENVL